MAAAGEISAAFDGERHHFFLTMMMDALPAEYQGQEINTLTLAYFALSSLHLLGRLDQVDRDQVVDWVLSFQCHPGDASDLGNGEFYGFCGSKSSRFCRENGKGSDISNIASTYSALAILKIVGYDLLNLDAESILVSMKHLQQPDGSFMPVHIGAENDLRFVYCAACICFMFNNWKGMDRERAKEYILACQSYDGGFGLIPGAESHGGATYCAMASLRLMGFIDESAIYAPRKSSFIDIPLLLEWCLQRQVLDGGIQGRSNKRSDTCYAFWIGGVLSILGVQNFIDKEALRRFILTCQSRFGGFGKFPEEFPDLYHSYYSYAALSLLQEAGLKPLCVELGIPAFPSTL